MKFRFPGGREVGTGAQTWLAALARRPCEAVHRHVGAAGASAGAAGPAGAQGHQARAGLGGSPSAPPGPVSVLPGPPLHSCENEKFPGAA
ncbi:unnamed protein product [Arctia plantaginis]|uniref:Uncharacterized protein n=1 Tax=Arctia plantaginis TaxID=874455 RepID=A0A8S0YLC5_ARCPL|nr:unnamed protein product [Arctia plantaginis]